MICIKKKQVILIENQCHESLVSVLVGILVSRGRQSLCPRVGTPNLSWRRAVPWVFPSKPRYAICKENPPTRYIVRAACGFLVPKRWSIPNLDSSWQADLVEMQDRQLIAANKRTRYLF